MRLIPRTRIDALTDGVFAIAMTILVLEIRLPANATYATPKDLLSALAKLEHEFLAYAISFFVLAMLWRGVASGRAEEEHPSQAHVSWWLVYLFLMTCIPISTSIVGNYNHLAPAVWLYAANMLLGGLAGWAMTYTGPHQDRADAATARVRISVLMACAVGSAVWGLFSPSNAMYAYLGNVASPWIATWQRKRIERSASS